MKQASILIVSRDRHFELSKTLSYLEGFIDKSEHEMLVFLDGTSDNSKALKDDFKWVNWYSSKMGLGASRARNVLYKKAKGKFLFGFDDDSYPIEHDFISKTIGIFEKEPEAGIISFTEIRGLVLPTKVNDSERIEEWVNQFVGCGFAIRRDVYFRTRGFPLWIDIYGEEVCLSIETLALNYKILYTNQVRVLHRKDQSHRQKLGGDILRFRKQLINTTLFYIVYYPFPLVFKKIFKLYSHNFWKYGRRDLRMFFSFVRALGQISFVFFSTIKFRRPISKSTLTTFNNLKRPHF